MALTDFSMLRSAKVPFVGGTSVSGDSSSSLLGLSSLSEVTFAMLVMVPFAFTLTTILIISEREASMLVKFHVRFGAEVRDAGLADTKAVSYTQVSLPTTCCV